MSKTTPSIQDDPRRHATHEEMVDALGRSGYMLEQRVENLLIGQEFEVEPNHRYRDPESGTAREVDIRAYGLALAGEDADQLFAACIAFVECENNSHPVVVFPKAGRSDEANVTNVKQTGILSNVWSSDSCEPTAVHVNMASFHHVCRIPTSTQYCTFHRPKDNRSPVIALHDERHHGTLDSLIKAMECEIERDLDDPSILESAQGGYINIYSAAVILQGELLAAFSSPDGLRLEQISHAVLTVRRPDAWPSPSQTYLVDIVRETHAAEYFSVIRDECRQLANELKGRKAAILESRKHLVARLRRLQPRPESFREFLVPRWWDHFARTGGLWVWQ